MSIKANPIFARLITAKKITARLIQTFSKICRYFSTFDGSSSYAALTDEIVLSGDFEITYKFKTGVFNNSNPHLGSNNELSYIRPDSNTLIKVGGASTGNYIFGNYTLLEDVWHELTFKRISGLLTLSVDEQSYSNGTQIGDFILQKVGSKGGSYFDGQLSDLKIWDGGDRNTGALVLDLPMSEGLKDVYDEVFYRNRVQAQAEWLLNLDGGYSSHQRLWNPDATDPSFSLEAYFDPSVTGTIVSQNVSNSGSGRELHISISSSNAVSLLIGGANFTLPPSGVGLYRVDFDGSNYTLFKDGTQIGSVSASIGTAREPSAEFRVGARNDGLGGAAYTYNGTIKDVKFWVNGTKSTGDLVLDSALDDNSNIIANAASPVNANAWATGSPQVIGDSEILSDTSVRIYSPAGGVSEVKYFTGVLGTDYLVTVTTEGDISKVRAGENSTQSSGWVNVRDEYGQPTNTYQTITNNPNVNTLVLKRVGVVDIVLTDISFVEVEGYGVLQGTRNTDYEWKNDTPHAIGYNVTTNEVCTTDGTNWVDSDLWIDGDPFID